MWECRVPPPTSADVPQALVYSEIYAFILTLLDDKTYMAKWHWETMAAYLGTAAGGLCVYYILMAIIAWREQALGHRTHAGLIAGQQQPGETWTDPVSGLAYDPNALKPFPVRNFVTAVFYMLMSIWFSGFVRGTSRQTAALRWSSTPRLTCPRLCTHRRLPTCSPWPTDSWRPGSAP